MKILLASGSGIRVFFMAEKEKSSQAKRWVRGLISYMGGNPRIGVQYPKMDGENHGKPY